MKSIHTDKAPAAVGPYSQAIIANGIVYCSGQIGIDPKTGLLVAGIKEQTKQVLRNLQSVLEAAGTNKASVIKTTIFLTDINNFTEVNTLYATFFASHKPARATIEVSNLPKGAIIEIEAIASVQEV